MDDKIENLVKLYSFNTEGMSFEENAFIIIEYIKEKKGIDIGSINIRHPYEFPLFFSAFIKAFDYFCVKYKK
jgi:hypothetical protein